MTLASRKEASMTRIRKKQVVTFLVAGSLALSVTLLPVISNHVTLSMVKSGIITSAIVQSSIYLWKLNTTPALQSLVRTALDPRWVESLRQYSWLEESLDDYEQIVGDAQEYLKEGRKEYGDLTIFVFRIVQALICCRIIHLYNIFTEQSRLH